MTGRPVVSTIQVRIQRECRAICPVRKRLYRRALRATRAGSALPPGAWQARGAGGAYAGLVSRRRRSCSRFSGHPAADPTRAALSSAPRSLDHRGKLLAAAGLVLMQSWVLRRTASTAIAADRIHYATDIATNLAVLAALGVTTVTAGSALIQYSRWRLRVKCSGTLVASRSRRFGSCSTENCPRRFVIVSKRRCCRYPAPARYTICARATPATGSLSNSILR